MDKEDKSTIIILLIVLISTILIISIVATSDYLNKKLDAEQPKYFIEFKENIYELKEVK